MTDRANEMCYVAKCHCGGLVMATVDEPDLQIDNAKQVARCIRKGYEVSRVPASQVNAANWCKCNRKKEKSIEQTQLID